MGFDVKRHFLVPKHVILPREETEEILGKLGLDLDKLPRIQKADPAIKDLKPEKNDIVKILRYSATAGKTIYYRRVV